MPSLRITAHAFDLQINETKVIRTASDVRAQPQHPMPTSGHQGYLYAASVAPGDRAAKGLLAKLTGFELNKSRCQMVGPIAERPFQLTRLRQPIH